ncbi:universal stress protein [Sphingomonas sp. GCM10030256]|uniref:universal stress protein n=1 Tax=Sphingomonas sp. GCM10030256 TaxID=3273427 RepID=UPI00361A3899
MKSILLHVQDNQTLVPRLEAALALARAFSAHLSCLHVTPIEAYAAVGAFDGAIFLPDVADALGKEEAQARSKIEEQLAAEDVSWDYEQVTGPVANVIIKHAALADLVVTGREDGGLAARRMMQIGLLGDLLHRCRTPLYIPPADGTPIDPVAPVLIAWDGSFEAANAVRSALPFLKGAASVLALEVRRSSEDEFPSTRLMEYLSRHDIHAELRTGVTTHEDVATVIVREASRAGVGTIVMGGYNHSRIGELVFGGVTRTLLLDCPLPLLMAH